MPLLSSISHRSSILPDPTRDVSFYLDHIGRRLQKEFGTSRSGYYQEANAGRSFECDLIRAKYWLQLEPFDGGNKHCVIVSAVEKPIVPFKGSVEDFSAGLNNWLEQGYQDLKRALLGPSQVREGERIREVAIYIPYEQSSGNRTSVSV